MNKQKAPLKPTKIEKPGVTKPPATKSAPAKKLDTKKTIAPKAEQKTQSKSQSKPQENKDASAPATQPSPKKKPAAAVAEKKSADKKQPLLSIGVARTLTSQDHTGEIGTRQLNLNHPYSVSAKMSLKESKKDDDLMLKNYKISTKFTVGDRLVHQEFGKGLVRDIIGEHKIKVSFKDFEKILVHGVN